MLPNPRLVLVGGVLIAIVILMLDLVTARPGAQREAVERPARGALMVREDHPEWRQFLILAAVRRAGELARLRELPDSPPQLPDAEDDDGLRVAALAAPPSDADDVTGSIAGSSRMALPVDIGETSSTELPLRAVPEQPPVVMPKQAKPAHSSELGGPRRARAKPPAKPAEPDLFTRLFGASQSAPQAGKR